MNVSIWCWQCNRASNAILRYFLLRPTSLRRTESLAEEILFNVLVTEGQRRRRFCPAEAAVAVAFPPIDCEVGATRLLRNVLMTSVEDVSWKWNYAYSFRRMYWLGRGGVLLVAPAEEARDSTHYEGAGVALVACVTLAS